MPSTQPADVVTLTFSVGYFLDPQPSDFRFGDYSVALESAFEMSIADQNAAIAVWRDTEVVNLFYGGERFRPEWTHAAVVSSRTL